MVIAMVGVILYSVFGMTNKPVEPAPKEPTVFQEKLPDRPEAPLPTGLFSEEEKAEP
jgi:hypothetical protein